LEKKIWCRYFEGRKIRKIESVVRSSKEKVRLIHRLLLRYRYRRQ
jgi:hypothetical protein